MSAVPLSTLLSQSLVAFTIEFDNEFEHRMPHRTTRHGSTGTGRDAPWLVSMAMWSNYMQHVRDDGTPVRELARRSQATAAALRLVLTRMSGWWGYLIVAPDPSDGRQKPPRADWLVRPTPAGRRAQEVWRPLIGVVERRWRDRFGAGGVDRARSTLSTVVRELAVELPEYLPVGEFRPRPGRSAADAGERSLPALLSKVLLAFAIEFDVASDVPIEVGANVLRLLHESEGVRLTDLPARAGVAREAMANSLGRLEKGGLVAVEPGPAPTRARLVRLTPRGRQAQERHRHRLETV
ncbi:MAG: hypothetical protein WAM30_09425, partial [Candidatus Dormiibacterota bacterium]